MRIMNFIVALINLLALAVLHPTPILAGTLTITKAVEACEEWINLGLPREAPLRLDAYMTDDGSVVVLQDMKAWKNEKHIRDGFKNCLRQHGYDIDPIWVDRSKKNGKIK